MDRVNTESVHFVAELPLWLESEWLLWVVAVESGLEVGFDLMHRFFRVWRECLEAKQRVLDLYLLFRFRQG